MDRRQRMLYTTIVFSPTQNNENLHTIKRTMYSSSFTVAEVQVQVQVLYSHLFVFTIRYLK